MTQPVTIDFETLAIEGNPVHTPPAPVGVAIYVPGQEAYYLAWGHPTGNNATREEATAHLKRYWDGPILFHNAPFDLSVATQHLGLPWPEDATKVHDTMYLVFLKDPYAKTFSLKPSAERYLGMPPEERDAVRDWVLRHVPGVLPSKWGAHIAQAPGDLVGSYAVGDVVRTFRLYEELRSQVPLEPYIREQRLMPILCEATRRGIDIARERLAQDAEDFRIGHLRATNAIFALLGEEFNLDSDKELAFVLESKDAVTHWTYTEKGSKSVARKNLHLKPEYAELQALLSYRGMMGTCLSTFVNGWLDLSAGDGKVHPSWNQVRGDRGVGGDFSGTRTGRLSCSNPNFQNVPDASEIPVPPGYPPLPKMRDYVVPPEGHIWLKRDFSAQEMRIMAHFAEGKLFDAYNKDPDVDPHEMVKRIIADLLGQDLPRKNVKITGFGIMYGRGITNLADALGVSYEEGAKTQAAYFAALPEVKELSTAIKRRGKSGGTITTWGGRQYVREPNEQRDLSYKLLNYLIQGSAADQTKQAIVDWHYNHRKSTDIFLSTVHDENNIAAPIDDKAGAMMRLRVAMDAKRFDVPFRSEGFAGPTWGKIQSYEA